MVNQSTPAGSAAAAASRPVRIAYQPIVDVDHGTIYAYEALARGPLGEGADWVFAGVVADDRAGLDHRLRVRAMEVALQLGLRGLLSVNLFPDSEGCPSVAIQRTLAAADALGFPYEQLMFEITEWTRVLRPARLREFIALYRDFGFKTALDDFGRGHSGLQLLSEFRPDIIKLDQEFSRLAPQDSRARTMIRHLLVTARDLGCTVIAEGVERADEAELLQDLGIPLQQGYWFARPAIEGLPDVVWAPRSASHVLHDQSRWAVSL